MKFCPNCGAERVGDAPFCYECGVKFEEVDAHDEKKKKSKSKQRKFIGKDKQERKPKQSKTAEPEQSEPKPVIDDNYDGYYEDVLPVDTEEIRQPLDKELIKRIILLVSGVIVVIAICILIMCYL